MAASAVSELLRDRKQAIIDGWALRVLERHELVALTRPVLIDHMPEFLDVLAAWMDGVSDAARTVFDVLAEGHALQRLGLGVSLGTVTFEYATLRSVVLRELLAVPTSDSIREPMVRINEAMDLAINESVRRYAAQREQHRDRFVGILGHDLRSPLSAIVLTAERLVAQPDPLVRRSGETIARSAERMTRMIEVVLDFARAKLGGGIPIALAPGDLGEICQAAVDEMAVVHPGCLVELERAGDLAGVWDRDRVLQVLSNLLGNAIAHGAPPIVLRAVETEDRRAIVMTVSNGGPPIPADRLPTLFDPFRGDRRPGQPGLGLGLYIVRQIAAAHAALCTVESTAEAGTTFTIRWLRTPLDEVDRA